MKPNFTRRELLSLGAYASAAALAAPSLYATKAHAAIDRFWTNIWGLAIRGYDPVAYFTEGRPVKGSASHELEWMGAKWRFASAANKATFEADPEAYAPQYGGYCAWAVSRGYTASVVPEAWRIVDGKLYLNFSKDVQRSWEGDIPGNIAKGDQNWPGLLGG